MKRILSQSSFFIPLLAALLCLSLYGCSKDKSDPSEDVQSATDILVEKDIVSSPDPDTIQPEQDTAEDTVVVLGECLTNEDCATVVEPGICETAVCNVNLQKCMVASGLEGSACDDGNECTTTTICSGGFCVISGDDPFLDCDDENNCTSNNCEPDSGCLFLPLSGGPCNDNDECTKEDHCEEGLCVGGADICPAQCGNETCQTSKGETCSSCPTDCGPCSKGCDANSFPGCEGCACESCVCELQPECCSESWSEDCVDLCDNACEQSCEGCDSSPLAGCGGCSCEECVCEISPSCCEEEWTPVCAALCASSCDSECINPCGNGVCDTVAGEDCLTCPEDCGACSTGCDTSVGPGCNDCPCESCVCDLDPSCCTDQWNQNCVTLCDGCGQSCSGCKAAPEIPGCHSCSCESCVCETNSFCCEIGWDEACISACEGCGTNCSGCNESPVPGCNGCPCEACVCNLIPSCCTDGWSALCATACTSECGGDCPAP